MTSDLMYLPTELRSLCDRNIKKRLWILHRKLKACMMMAGMHPLLRLMDFIRLIDVASKELETFIYDDAYDPSPLDFSWA